MEAVVTTRANPSKRRYNRSINWDLCIFCQSRPDDSKNVTRTLGDTGLARVRQALCDHQKYNDHTNLETVDRLAELNFDAVTTKMLYHKDCYSSFTSSHHIARLKAKYDKSTLCSQTSTNTSSAHTQLRSRKTILDTDLCIFCQSVTKKPTSLVATFEASNKILKAAQWDCTMRCRLAGLTDLVAADARYHLQCYVQFTRKTLSSSSASEGPEPTDLCMETLAAEVSNGIDHGDIYTLKDAWDRYSHLLEEFDIEPGTYRQHKTRFKEKLEKLLPGQIDFVLQLDPHQPQLLFSTGQRKVIVQTLKKTVDELDDDQATTDLKPSRFSDTQTEELLALHHTALRIRGDIKTSPGHNKCASITKEDVEKVIPENLFMLISVLLTGEVDDPEENSYMKRTVLSICQDIVYAVSKRKKLTPKHIGLGLAIHQATRSKSLIDLLHQAGHCISYDQVRRLDTTLAAKNLETFAEHGNTPVPTNIAEGKFCQYAADNIDLIEEKLDGMGTFHATQMVVYQRGQMHKKSRELPLGKDKSLKVPPEHSQLEHVPRLPARENPSFIENIDESMFKPDQLSAEKASAKDLAWIVSRIYGSESDAVPAWTGFNQVTTPDEHERCIFGYLPLINAPAHEYNTLWTVLMRCPRISHIMNPGQSTVITLDQQLYCKAKELQWANPNQCRTIFVRLGGFHIAKNFMCVIGNHFAESGLPEVWSESMVFGENTAHNNMAAKSYNRAIRAHKLTFEAVWKLLWPLFIAWAEDHDVIENDLKTLAHKVVESLEQHNDVSTPADRLTELEDLVRNSNMLKLLEAFEATETPTTQFWITYLKMVSILLQFVRAERSGNWQLHKSAFAAMLPWYALYDHTNYTRWGAIYLADVMQLETSHPDVHREFLAGNFVVKTTRNAFNQLSTDQALEHVNKVGKVAGGIIGITKSEGARDRWCLTFNERSRLVDETSEMLDMHTQDTEFYPVKELGPSRMQRDEQDVQKIVEQLRTFGIFQHENPTVVCLATRHVAPDHITESLLTAQTRGQEKVQKFVESRLIKQDTGFHDTLKQSKSPTLKTMYQVGPQSKDVAQKGKAVKADRILFQRLLISKDAGCQVDLKEILCHELSPVPLSLADISPALRPSNKAALGKILQTSTTVEKQLQPTSMKTCVIIDGQALVQAIGKPANAKCFGDLATAFTTSVFSHFTDTCSRVDVVFDRYEHKSIKDTTRLHRTGRNRPIRRKIESKDVPLPVNWKQFIDLPENKQDLENFLSIEMMIRAKATLRNCEVVTSGGFHDRMAAESSLGTDVTPLKASHDEADTRLILHAKTLATQGYERTVIHSRDTDVLVLLVHFAQQLSTEVWFRTGTAAQRNYVAVHSIDIDPVLRSNLPAFHAVTGCDTVSQFCGIGKATAWKVYQKYGTLLNRLGRGALTDCTERDMEEFVCRLYHSNESDTKINDVRFKMFTKGTKEPEKLPPTQSSLQKHIKRAHHQSVVWFSSLVAQPDICSPIGNGWQSDSSGNILPHLSSDEPFPSMYLELTQCQCKRCDTARCKCRARKLRCTAGCGCSDRICQNPLNIDDDSD